MPASGKKQPPPTMTFLTTQEVAERLRVHPRTVKRWLDDGQLEGFVLGDRAGWRISEAELARFVEHQRAKSAKAHQRPHPTEGTPNDDH